MVRTTALLVIDVQRRLMEIMAPELVQSALPRIADLVRRARATATPILYIQHDSGAGGLLQAGTPGWQLHPEIGYQEGDPVIPKRECDAFFETALTRELEARGIGRLVVSGAMTEFCIDTNCRRATSMGYDVALASDAHLTRNNKVLTAQQIVAHHNKLLQGFGAGGHKVAVQPAGEIGL